MDQPLDAELLDLTKENIQPLKHGRRADQLFTALHAELDTNAQKKLDEQREQFELAIRMYEGDDPLEPRYQFAHWIEQTYLKLGPNSKLLPLLEDTINLYKDDKRYRQDQRFIEMLVKFINAQTNPIELYQLSYNQGLGTMCAILYHSWAEELDANNDWRRANQIYELGVMNRAEPLDKLRQAHEQFQLSVGRRMMNEEDEDEGEGAGERRAAVVAPSRQAFSKLKRAQVKGGGSSRLPHGLPGVLRAQAQTVLAANSNNNRRPAAIPIYQENSEDNFTGGSSRAQIDLFPKAAVINKENSQKAGPWKNPHVSKSRSSHAVVPPSTPSFHVYEETQEEKKVNYQTPIVPRALKSIRAVDIACPVAIFEAPDPTKKVMYAKHKVYVGGRELQLEEIRAAIYNKRYGIETGQKEMCEFQTPMIHFGKKPSASLTASTPHPEPKVLPVRLFSDNSDNSDVEDDKDGQSIKFYRNDKNVISDDLQCEVGVDKLKPCGDNGVEIESAAPDQLPSDPETIKNVPLFDNNCDKRIVTTSEPTLEPKVVAPVVCDTVNVPESSNKSDSKTRQTSSDVKSVATLAASSSKVHPEDFEKLKISSKLDSREKDEALVKKKSRSQLNDQKGDRLKVKNKSKPTSGLPFTIFTD